MFFASYNVFVSIGGKLNQKLEEQNHQSKTNTLSDVKYYKSLAEMWWKSVRLKELRAILLGKITKWPPE